MALVLKPSVPDQGAAVNGPRYVFSGLLLILSLMLLEHAVDLSGYFYKAPALIDVIAPGYLFIGPLLYGYTLIQTAPVPPKFHYRDLLHGLPALAHLVISLPFILSTDYDAKLALFYDHNYEMLGADITAEADIHCEGFWPRQWGDCLSLITVTLEEEHFTLSLYTPLALLWLGDLDIWGLVASLVGYIYLSFRLLRRHEQRLYQLTSEVSSHDLKWLQHFLSGITMAACVYVVSMILDELDIPNLELFARNYLIYSFLGVSVVYVGFKALWQPAIFSPEWAEITVEIEQSLDSSENNNGCVSPAVTKYQNSALSQDSAEDLRRQIERHMEQSQCYLDNDLSLPSLACQLDIGAHALSQVLNETIGHNFFEFVNSYRLEFAKQQLVLHPQENILQIAMDSGFSSKSSFYNVFKKSEGITPSQWRKRVGRK